MKVKIMRGPNEGQIVHVPRDQHSELGLLLGDLQLIPEDPPPQLPPKFSVHCTLSGIVTIQLQMFRGNMVASESHFAGHWRDAKGFFKHTYRLDLPADVLEIYRLKTSPPSPEEQRKRDEIAEREAARRRMMEEDSRVSILRTVGVSGSAPSQLAREREFAEYSQSDPARREK